MVPTISIPSTTSTTTAAPSSSTRSGQRGRWRGRRGHHDVDGVVGTATVVTGVRGVVLVVAMMLLAEMTESEIDVRFVNVLSGVDVGKDVAKRLMLIMLTTTTVALVETVTVRVAYNLDLAVTVIGKVCTVPAAAVRVVA